MRIFINQKETNNIKELLNDPSVEGMASVWDKDDIYGKSAVELSLFQTPFASISLLYGPRQIGKTASLKLFLSRLSDSEALIFTDCSAIVDKADLYRHLDQLIGQGKTTVVLDEVQAVPDWHLSLRSLYSEGRLKQCRMWCTGSEARYLLESGERLPGRKGLGKTIFARPWSFREYLDFFYPDLTGAFRDINWQHQNQMWLEAQTVNWERPWVEYCLAGGIPHAVGLFRKHGEIGDPTWKVYVDWILGSWSKMRTPQRSLAALSRRLCETLNSRVSFESLKKGTDIGSANTVKGLLEIQEDHFSLRVLPRFDIQKKKFLPSKLKKIFPLDPFTARVYNSIGRTVTRLYDSSVPALPLDECAFLTQTFRWENTPEVSYLYSETKKSELDFYFKDCAFELKSGGNPTKNQWELLNQCSHSFVIRKQQLPLMSYLVGEGRPKS